MGKINPSISNFHEKKKRGFTLNFTKLLHSNNSIRRQTQFLKNSISTLSEESVQSYHLPRRNINILKQTQWLSSKSRAEGKKFDFSHVWVWIRSHQLPSHYWMEEQRMRNTKEFGGWCLAILRMNSTFGSIYIILRNAYYLRTFFSGMHKILGFFFFGNPCYHWKWLKSKKITVHSGIMFTNIVKRYVNIYYIIRID